MEQHYPFTLLPLPYPYNALEPSIDCQTVTVHHDRHQAGYVKKLNEALAGYPQYHCWSLEQLICDCAKLPHCIRTEVLRNAGGVYAHELYFDGMSGSPAACQPCGKLAEAIERCFCSFERFQDVMTQTALAQFGSGWAWLVAAPDGSLCVCSTANQDTPLSHGMRPILCVDVWEHAYYLKYLNLRADYLEAWWKVVDWNFAEQNYLLGLPKKCCRGS